MRDHFNCLLILPKNKKQSKQDYYTASKHFPMDAHFEYSHKSALAYLKNCAQEDFPSLIIVEDEMGYQDNIAFIEAYRAQFYLFNMDTLLFNCSLNNNILSSTTKRYPAMISDRLYLDRKCTYKRIPYHPYLSLYTRLIFSNWLNRLHAKPNHILILSFLNRSFLS